MHIAQNDRAPMRTLHKQEKFSRSSFLHIAQTFIRYLYTMEISVKSWQNSVDTQAIMMYNIDVQREGQKGR